MDSQIYESIHPDFHVPPDLSLSQLLQKYNPEDVPETKVILEGISPGGRQVTYGELRNEAATMAAYFTTVLGLSTGDTVAIYAPNSVQYPILAHSVMWFGGVIAGMNALTSVQDLVHYLKISRPSAVITNHALRMKMEEAVSRVKDVDSMVLDLDELFTNMSRKGLPPCAPFDLSGKDNRQCPASIMFSSGTSGKPKAVIWSHYSIIAHVLQPRITLPEQNSCLEREVVYAPLCHMLGFIGAVLKPAFLGCYAVILERFHYETYIQACAKARVTIMKMIPATAVAIAKDRSIEQHDLSNVRHILCTGATLQAQIVRRLQEIMKSCAIIQSYGLSEIGVSILKGARSSEKSGSVGRLFPGNKLRIVDEKLQDVPTGHAGEALVRGPTLFMEYKNDLASTREAFHKGWFRTGDILSMDSDGFLWFHDRQKEMIKYKGNLVAPAELENLLAAHGDVLEAAVCGYFDESQQTDIPVGYVKLRDSVAFSDRDHLLEKIKKSVDDVVSSPKKLRGGLFYLAELPKNATGKIMRAHLPARLVSNARKKRASKI
ncbi:acyl-CoA synthetases/AMP-acid ligases II [Penicillium odoratum]|uniref:acyl-CoA synthetases/AMP-acid ligases II n=1 Tax=Penicillium odoratum TaxID=1167516 RepID=UPI0025487603|nr:acyl-CoA synthetases/AMP-acid ligases II [Penicillium odoratum]KAJ5753302.1 acyl-CoA synthetases/AMP-acid ligases II [Penicillium odoratum]